MAESKTVKFQFTHKGLVTKEDPTLLGDGQYRSMSNMEVNQEGALSSRAGKKLLGTLGTTISSVYMIRKMTVTPNEDPATPATNPRYLGIDTAGANWDLYRSVNYTAFTKVASDINTTAALSRVKPFSLAAYATGGLGAPWAFLASEAKMLKDRGSSGYATLVRWGILPAFGVALAASSATWPAPAAGLLDGGDAASPNGSQPYDYRYTFVSGDTSSEGNPSQTMLDGSEATQAGFGGDLIPYIGTPVAVNLRKIKVLVWGITATGVNAEITTINIYRRGGILFDNWRLVGSVANPGTGTQAAFIDNIADVDLVFAPILVTDNDPPVTSTVAGKTGATGLLPATSAGRQTVTLTAGSFSIITPGTIVHCVFNNQEDVVVESTNGTTQFTAYFQFNQDVGTTVFADALTGQPAYLAMNFGQFLIVAGDPNNPHLLYRSKGDQPEAFAVLPADGSVAIQAYGTPSNPVVNFCAFRGQILTLNVSSLFEGLLISGSFVQPAEVGNRGLVATRAFCKTETEVWFLSNDGIWSWDGGTLRKRTEAIDPIFHGREFNSFLPLDYGFYISHAVMEYRRGEVHLLYRDAAGTYHELVCELAAGDRWRPVDPNSATFLYAEPDTQSLVEARVPAGVATFALLDQIEVSSDVNYASDYFTSSPITSGSPIAFNLLLPQIDFGSAVTEKLIQEVYLDLDVSLSTIPNATLLIDTYLNFLSTISETFTFNLSDTLTATGLGSRALVSILPSAAAGPPVTSYGVQCRVFSLRIRGTANPTLMAFYSLVIVYSETGALTAGGARDWTDLGHKQDKKLYQMAVEFDTAGASRVLILDTLSGREGNTYTADVQEFTLYNPAILGSGRGLKTFPILDGVIVKQVRLRAKSTGTALADETAFFKTLDYRFEKEDYPPDIVSFTPWKDDGYSYLKYANQVTLEVNTNGIAITVILQADGTDKFTFAVTAYESDRQRNITVPAGLSGYRWRLYVDPAQTNLVNVTGMFQLFNYAIKFQQADKGEVGHTFDWDDLGHPYDKQLSVVTIEWDNTGGSDVVMELDTLTGIDGDTIALDVQEFTLSGGRSKRTFPLPVDLIVKMIRLHPKGDTIPASFKQWKYSFAKTDYPADIVLFTEWRNAETLNDKNPTNISIDADTAGVAATVILENEAGTVLTFTHTGTVTDRERNYAIPVDVSAKMWRLQATPGTLGKFQLFGWTLTRWHAFEQGGPEDPPDVILFVPWKDFGYPYPKIARNLILTIDTGGVACSIPLQTSEDGTVQTFTVTTTYTTRRVILPCNPELIGTQWRLLLAAGSGGLSKLFDWDLETIKEPAAVNQWSAYQQGFGYNGFKILFQIWLEYKCASPITVTFVSSTGTLVMSFPAHATRAAERQLFPSAFGSGLNKSILYSITINSTVAANPFSVYADVSGIEWVACGVERRGTFTSMKLSEFMSIPI